MCIRDRDEGLPESVNFEEWPKPDEVLRDRELEQAFDTLQRCVALVYSARQMTQLKRRWPLQRAVVVVPEQVQVALESLEDVFLELVNVKVVEFVEEAPKVDEKEWSVVSGEGLQVLLYTRRDKSLLGEGVMRDLARRVQSLRKELGFSPTDVLDAVHLAELDAETMRLLEPYLAEMAELVRTQRVYLHRQRSEFEAEWHTYNMDEKRVYVAIA